MPYPHQKLPGKEELERIYVVEGLSFAEIAERFGVRTKTVNNTMRLRAKKAGTAWPLKQRRPDWRKRAAKKHSESHHDSVTSSFIALEIRDICALTGCTAMDIVRKTGLSTSAIYDVLNGRRPRIQRRTAERIMAVIEDLERTHRRREHALHALNARREKIAREKAAGERPLSQKDVRRGVTYS